MNNIRVDSVSQKLSPVCAMSIERNNWTVQRASDAWFLKFKAKILDSLDPSLSLFLVEVLWGNQGFTTCVAGSHVMRIFKDLEMFAGSDLDVFVGFTEELTSCDAVKFITSVCDRLELKMTKHGAYREDVKEVRDVKSDKYLRKKIHCVYAIEPKKSELIDKVRKLDIVIYEERCTDLFDLDLVKSFDINLCKTCLFTRGTAEVLVVVDGDAVDNKKATFCGFRKICEDRVEKYQNKRGLGLMESSPGEVSVNVLSNLYLCRSGKAEFVDFKGQRCATNMDGPVYTKGCAVDLGVLFYGKGQWEVEIKQLKDLTNMFMSSVDFMNALLAGKGECVSFSRRVIIDVDTVLSGVICDEKDVSSRSSRKRMHGDALSAALCEMVETKEEEDESKNAEDIISSLESVFRFREGVKEAIASFEGFSVVLKAARMNKHHWNFAIAVSMGLFPFLSRCDLFLLENGENQPIRFAASDLSIQCLSRENGTVINVLCEKGDVCGRKKFHTWEEVSRFVGELKQRIA